MIEVTDRTGRTWRTDTIAEAIQVAKLSEETFMYKCGNHNRVLVARRMTWTDRYKRVRSMIVYVCPVPGCGKMRSNKRVKPDMVKP